MCFIIFIQKSVTMMMILVYQTAKSPAAEFSWIEKLTRSTKNLATAGKDTQDAADSVSYYPTITIVNY